MASPTPRPEAPTGETPPHWPEGSVRALLGTDHVSPATRAALRARLDTPVVERPKFFDDDAFLTMRAICARLVAQAERGEEAVDVAGVIDAKLADGKRDGWRYAKMPPDPEAYRRGLRGIDETAQVQFGELFRNLEPACQDAILAAVQAGRPCGATWRELSPSCFFEELLAEVVDVYYAHPLAQEEIGYVGMADAHGWQAIGLDKRDPHEPAAAPSAPAKHRGAA